MKFSIFRVTRRRSAMLLGVGGILAAAVGVVPAQAAAPVPLPDAAFSGSASGDAIHVDAILGNGAVDVGHGSTAVNSKGITPAATDPDIKLPINPNLPSKNAYAFGRGIEALTLPLVDKAESSALPNAAPVVKEQGPVKGSPAAYASLVRGYAATKWNPDNCVLGTDLAKGYGYAADAQVVNAGPANPDGTFSSPVVSADTGPNTRDVVQSTARETIVPVADGVFGLQSQVITQLAPITLGKGTPSETTILVAGDFVLTAIASGIPGKSTVTYKPAGAPADPTLPIVTIIQAGKPNILLTFQQILGQNGVVIPIPGVATISIAQPPVQSISADGTTVSASADVVRVVLADAALSNIRIGHAAVKAQVPAGGLACPLPVTKSANPASLSSGESTTVSITITNPFDCELINVSAIDVITRTLGDVKFIIVEDDPANDPQKGAGATFTKDSDFAATASYANLGTIAPGGSKVVKVVIKALSGSGNIQDIATAKGTLNCGEGSALGKATVNLSGSFTLITKVLGVLARTGGTAGVALALAGTAIAAVVTRRVSRTRRAQA